MNTFSRFRHLAHISRFFISLTITVTCSTASNAASMINVELPYEKYGKESNIGGRCAATSMINSFVYLNNIAGNLYKNTNLLTGPNQDKNMDGMIDLKDSIIALDDLMGGGGCGVNRQEAWEGKLEWFDLYAPNTTIFAGMVNEDFTNWKGSQYLTFGVPTIDFLLKQLRDEEDVELRIGFDDGSGHYVTLTSLHINDLNMNGMWDPDNGETASIDYIDPNCPSGTDVNNPGPSLVPLSRENGVLKFDWFNGNGTVCNHDPMNNPPERAMITAAWSESPKTPEPSTIFSILTIGGLSFTKLLKKQQ